MRCKHDEGFDWSDAELDKRNGGWKVRCRKCGEVLTMRRLATPESIARDVKRNGPKVHMSKKERLTIRRRADALAMREKQAEVEA